MIHLNKPLKKVKSYKMYVLMIEKWKNIGWKYVVPTKNKTACLISNYATMMQSDGSTVELDVYTKKPYLFQYPKE